MSLSGVKRTCRFAAQMSAFDPKRTLAGSLKVVNFEQTRMGAINYQQAMHSLSTSVASTATLPFNPPAQRVVAVITLGAVLTVAWVCLLRLVRPHATSRTFLRYGGGQYGWTSTSSP
jgi:hypothetical protein